MSGDILSMVSAFRQWRDDRRKDLPVFFEELGGLRLEDFDLCIDLWNLGTSSAQTSDPGTPGSSALYEQ